MLLDEPPIAGIAVLLSAVAPVPVVGRRWHGRSRGRGPLRQWRCRPRGRGTLPAAHVSRVGRQACLGRGWRRQAIARPGPARRPRVEEPQAQPGVLLLVPGGGLTQFSRRFWTKREAAGHLPPRSSRRASRSVGQSASGVVPLRAARPRRSSSCLQAAATSSRVVGRRGLEAGQQIVDQFGTLVGGQGQGVLEP